MGNSGILNFSTIAFMAIGAYTSALLTMPPGMKSTFLPDLPAWLAAAQIPPLAGAGAGGVLAALVALVLGLPIMRLSGIAAAIATISLMIICYIVLGNWTWLTGGQQSPSPIRKPGLRLRYAPRARMKSRRGRPVSGSSASG
jgi:branched-chain amino acid transport system permease protein